MSNVSHVHQGDGKEALAARSSSRNIASSTGTTAVAQVFFDTVHAKSKMQDKIHRRRQMMTLQATAQ